MSFAAMKWVLLECDADEYVEFRLLMALAERANDDGTGAWPSVPLLAKRVRRSPRTVQRALKRLRDAGRIRLGDQTLVPAKVAANQRPTVWDVVIPGVTPDVAPGSGARVTDDVTPDKQIGTTPVVTPEPDSGVTSDDTAEAVGVTGGVIPEADAGVTPGDVLGVTPDVIQLIPPSLRKENVLSSCSTAPQLNLIDTPASEAASKLASKPEDPEGFHEFWSIYPRRVARGQAVKAFAKALKRADLAEILEGARRYAAARKGENPTYTAHPSSWLNGDRWADEPDSVRRPGHERQPSAAPMADPRTGNLVEARW
ncbi:helix-turn-helix domain-containing protein [Nocardia gipuzkoensis]